MTRARSFFFFFINLRRPFLSVLCLSASTNSIPSLFVVFFFQGNSVYLFESSVVAWPFITHGWRRTRKQCAGGDAKGYGRRIAVARQAPDAERSRVPKVLPDVTQVFFQRSSSLSAKVRQRKMTMRLHVSRFRPTNKLYEEACVYKDDELRKE